MKNIAYFRFLLLFSLTFLMGTFAKASHYIGSEVTYTCLGGNQYEIRALYYADCSAGSMGNFLVFDAFSTCNPSVTIFTSLVGSAPVDITPGCATNQTSCNGGTGSYGINRYEYIGTATLPACSDWVINYDACCRSNTATNLNFPTTQDHYVFATLDNTNNVCNNSPQFENEPILIGCVGDTLSQSFNASDADSDSLVYSLINCLSTSTTASVTYSAGFSGTAPFSGTTTIDAQTGLITILPTTAQSGYLCVKVEEYRNGNKIGEVVQDILMTMQNCTNSLPKVNQINGGNIALNSQFSAMTGVPLSIDFYIYDADVQAGMQNLSASLTSNLVGATTSFNAATSIFNLTWTPTAAAVGKKDINIAFEDDNCSFLGQGQHTVQVVVSSSPSVTAIDDYYTIFQGQTVSGNLLMNDVSNGNLVANSSLVVSPVNGVVSLSPNGTFIYLSNPGFVGLDTFDYQVCNGAACDIATVFVNISPVYYITDTIVLGENYSDYYCFTSDASYLTDTLNNIVLSTTNDTCFTLYGDYLGTDTTILISNNEMVYFYLTVVNGVWPGDTDDDALVNNFDLLNIGLAYNAVGVPRSQQSILWNGYLADDWTMTFPNGLNAKHADTDGNGIVNADDTVAIIQNWGLSYTKGGGSTGAPLYIETDSMILVNDSIAYLPIMLGDMVTPVTNIYGLAFTITYNSGLVKDNSVMVHFDPSWLGTTNVDMISIDKDFYGNERVEVAVTRTDGMNIGGNGQIGRMCFTIQDDIIRGVDSTFYFGINNIVGLRNDAVTVDISGESREIDLAEIVAIANNTQAVDLSKNIAIYPNPASNLITIETTDLEIENIEIFDLTGRKVLEKNQLNNRNQLNVSQLTDGLYIINIKTNKGNWNEKLMIK